MRRLGARLAIVFATAWVLSGVVSLGYLNADAAGPGFARHGLPLDDSWIHLVYARSIARGEPFQYNPGEWETGSTSPLWALVLAPALLLGFAPVVATKFLGVLWMAAAATAGYRLALRLGEERVGIAFALALPLLPYFSFTAVSGTEVPLFLFGLLVTLDLALAQRWTAAFGAAALATLARPEGALLLVLLVVSRLIEIARHERPIVPGRVGVEITRLCGVVLVVLGPWIAYCLWATGRPLPSTFYVKAEWLGPFDTNQFHKIGSFLWTQPFLGFPEGSVLWTLLGALGGCVLFVVGVFRLLRIGWTALVMIAFLAPVYYYALSMELPLGRRLGPDDPDSVRNFYYARYLLPGLVPILLVVLLGLTSVVRFVGSRLGRMGTLPKNVAQAVALVVLCALPVTAAYRQHEILRSVYSWNCQNIEKLNVGAAKWIAANLPAGVPVGVSDAGALRFFGEHRIVDLAGLNYHPMIPVREAVDRVAWKSVEEARILEDFFQREPIEYLAVTKGWHGRILGNRRGEILGRLRLERNTICGSNELRIARLQPVRVRAPGEARP